MSGASKFDPHPSLKLTKHGNPVAIPHLGLDLVGLVNPPLNKNFWITVPMEYFTKWVEAISLHKATRGTLANFIKENIITRFGIPHRIISDNGMPFVNREVRRMLDLGLSKSTRHPPNSPHLPGFDPEPPDPTAPAVGLGS